jgi:predicted amidohydrolase YtcJ
MTIDAAYAAFAERDLGSLTPGKRADFVVLDRDIMSVSIEQVLETKVKATIIDGGLIFGGLE